MTNKNNIPQPPHRSQQNDGTDLLAGAAAFLDQHPMRFVLRHGCYFVRRLDNEWIVAKPASMKHHHPEWTVKGFPIAVTTVLNDRGFAFNDVTYSFRDDLPADMLNLADRSGWLEPDGGDYHWVFDVLIQSLGGGKPLNMEHIEHILAYKYLYPQTYTLPCLVIHGEGGVGKNLLVDHVLHIVFAGQTFSGKADHIVGTFNALLKGKAVVMIDEAENDKINDSALKHMLQRERLTINDKGIAHYEVDNTPLYFISSNKSEGGVWLDRSQADRRYSVLHVRKGQPIQYWIARHQHWIEPDQQTLEENDSAFQRAYHWLLNEGAAILRDRVQVANWLGHILVKHGDNPQPLPLHGDDFTRLMDIQKPMGDRIIEAVFSDPDFTHIERRVLYRGYRALCAAGGYKKVLGDAKFYEKVRDLIRRNWPDIGEEQVRQNDGHPTCWYALYKPKGVRKKNNGPDYVVKDGYNDAWVGPEV